MKNECRSKEARKVRYSREKGFQKGRITRKIYSKNVI